jgi:low affinity Fe/Cu permease
MIRAPLALRNYHLPDGVLCTMEKHPIRRALTLLGQAITYPAAFLVVPIYGVLWFTFDKASWDWHAIATLTIWFMTLIIVRSEHRDTVALHAKLDELLRVQGQARNELMSLDEKDLEEVEKRRDKERAAANATT